MVIDNQLIIGGSFNYTGPANRLNDENIFIDQTLSKFKQNERELKREKRFEQLRKEREFRLQKKLDEWLNREQARTKNKQREEKREQ